MKKRGRDVTFVNNASVNYVKERMPTEERIHAIIGGINILNDPSRLKILVALKWKSEISI